MSDVVDRLRSWVYTDSLYATAQEAADEIERLRSRLRFADAVIRSGDVAALTDAEREAVKEAIGVMDWHRAYFSHLKHEEPLPSAALRGLLERLA